MKRMLLLALACFAFAAFACGVDKQRDEGLPAAPTADAPADDDRASSDDGAPFEDEANADDGDESGGGSGLVSQLLNLGVGGATTGGPGALPGLQQGGGDLEQYLLSDGDAPPGYETAGTFSSRLPADHSNDFPGGEMAAIMYMSGDLSESSDVPSGSMLMVMVMRPDDASAIEDLASELGGFSEDDLAEEFGGDASFLGIEIKDIETLDTTGLGDNAGGVGLTMDMSGFFEGLQEGFGDELGEDVPPDLIETFSSIRMRMTMFGEGDKLGMVMQIGFDDDLADDLELAQKLRRKF